MLELGKRAFIQINRYCVYFSNQYRYCILHMRHKFESSLLHTKLDLSWLENKPWPCIGKSIEQLYSDVSSWWTKTAG